MTGYECTIFVPSMPEIVAAIRAQKGNIMMEDTVIVGIGRLVLFEDTEGKLAGRQEIGVSTLLGIARRDSSTKRAL